MSRQSQSNAPVGRRVVVLLLALGGLSCAESDKKKWDDIFRGRGPSLFSGASETEEWTIECNEYKGPGHRQMADKMATSLKQVPDLKGRDVWVEHLPSSSRVFCGSYHLRYRQASVDNETRLRGDLQIDLNDKIKGDLAMVRSLSFGNMHPFFSARPIPRPIPDCGPPEWDLRNAKGAYTLNVGVTYATPTLHNYKEAAVEWVKDLRSRGHEAYYYHDPVQPRSSVCIGTFGEDALIVLPGGRMKLGDSVQRLRAREEFRWNLENGVKTFRSVSNFKGETKRLANESFLAKIPQESTGESAATASKSQNRP